MLYRNPPIYRKPNYEVLGGILSFLVKYNIPIDEHLRYVLTWVTQTNRIKVWYDPAGNVKAIVWWVNVSRSDANEIISNQSIVSLRPWYFDSGPHVVAFALTAHYNNFWIKTWLRNVLFSDVALMIKKVEHSVPNNYVIRSIKNHVFRNKKGSYA